jgi:hypothetical protein
MKRACIFAALMTLLLSGCMTSSQDPVYSVMFEEAPRLFDAGVYFQGERIGEIRSNQSGPALVHKVTISVPESARQMVKTSTAFIVSAGRLNLIQLTPHGEPLPLGSAVLGFQSRAALIAFRLKHLMQPLPAAAMQEAARLHDAAG